jgi:hypothetical protein
VFSVSNSTSPCTKGLWMYRKAVQLSGFPGGRVFLS